jgi:4-amino-4-deoxychorismate lyase
MSQFFETIKYCQGEFFLLDYHQERLNRTRKEVFGLSDTINLNDFLINPPIDDSVYRCRVSYDEYILSVDFFEYQLTTHKSVKIFDAGNYDYAYKSEHRAFLNDALTDSGADDVLFIREGKPTDSTYANLALFKNGNWYTPDTYLLNGVKRQFLIKQGLLKPMEISIKELDTFEKISFINALRDFELVYTFKQTADKLDLTLVQ